MRKITSEADLMRGVRDFLANLTDDQIDLIDKLGNMYCNSISEETYDAVFDNDELMQKVNDRIRAIAMHYMIDVYYETINLRNIQGTDDFDLEGGLYNCDQLYVKAIEDVLK